MPTQSIELVHFRGCTAHPCSFSAFTLRPPSLSGSSSVISIDQVSVSCPRTDALRSKICLWEKWYSPSLLVIVLLTLCRKKMETVTISFYICTCYTYVIQKPSHVGAWQQVIQRHLQSQQTFKEHLSSLLSRIQNNLDKIQSIVTQSMQFRETTDEIQNVGTKACVGLCLIVHRSINEPFLITSVSMVSMCIPQNPGWSEIQAKVQAKTLTMLTTVKEGTTALAYSWSRTEKNAWKMK